MGRENGIVWLDDGSGDPWCWVNSKLKLRLLAVVGGETFEEEGSETRTSSTTKRVEDQETLKRVAVVLTQKISP